MPSINPNQFGQLSIPGVDRDALNEGRPFAPYDPGPDYKRGQVGVGQRQMNLDLPGRADLEVGTGGLVPVDDYADPDWQRDAWRVGGYFRGDNPIARQWEDAPVRTFGPDTEIRTNQMQPEASGLEVDVMPDRVASLRNEEFFLRDDSDDRFFDPDADPEVRPWIARVSGKNYLLEGHHRAVASRTRGTGEFDAHVIEAENWEEMIHGKFDLPRDH